MLENTTIHLKVTNPDTGCAEDSGETISIYQLTKAMTPANFATLLEDYLNRGGKGFREGKEIGLATALHASNTTTVDNLLCSRPDRSVFPSRSTPIRATRLPSRPRRSWPG